MLERDFRAALVRMKHIWRFGLALSAVMETLGSFAVTLTVLGALDFFLAFDPRMCLAFDIAALAGLGALFVRGLIRIGRLDESDTARRADELLKSRRGSILSALELAKELRGNRAGLPALQAYLMDQSVEKAGEELGRLRFRDHVPFPEIRKRARGLGFRLAVVALVAMINRDATSAILARFLTPLRDTPPYSRYVFTVSPEMPAVIYGGNAEVSVRITGAPVRPPVWFLTRYKGKTRQAACFQESGGQYAQRLERVVSPVEFCFATGRARSRWRPVELLLQPEIRCVDVAISPPAYTGKPRRQFRAGKEDLAGYRRSRVEMTVRSNRPLADGVLTLRPKHGLADDRVVKGEKSAMDAMTFAWAIEDDARLEVAIRDVRGTKNREPLIMEQKVIPDKPPEVSLNEPGGFSLATPRISLALSGQASDDLGLRKVELARTVAGYRDRLVKLGPSQPEEKLDFSRKLDLQALGVQPGQVLEFYLEAGDTNPDMTGVVASDVSRVQIISEKEYAEMMRARTTVEAFAKRYQVLQAAMAGYSQALEDAVKTAISAEDPAQTAKSLRAAAGAGNRAADELMKIAMDFPIFDMEESLRDPLLSLIELIRRQARQLEQMQAPYDGAVADVRQMLAELHALQKPIEEQVVSAGEVAAVAEVMEMAAVFKGLTRQQADLVRRLERFSLESPDKDVKLLAALGKRQEEIRAALAGMADELRRRASKLPAYYAVLKADAEKFIALMVEYRIGDLMRSAVNQAENQAGRKTYDFARLALEKMEELAGNTKEDPFGGMLQNCLAFNVKEALKATLKEMLGAILARGGMSGTSPGTRADGGIIGGDLNDGYWSGGYSVLNIPILGPSRMSFESPSQGGTAGSGTAGKCAAVGSTTAATSEAMGSRERGAVESESQQPENLPEKYRNAIKRYFSATEEHHE